MQLVIKQYKRKRVGAFETVEVQTIIRNPADMVVFPDGSVSLAGSLVNGVYSGSVPVKPEDLEVTQIRS